MRRERIKLAKRVAYDVLGVVVFALIVGPVVLLIAVPLYNGARLAAGTVSSLFD